VDPVRAARGPGPPAAGVTYTYRLTAYNGAGDSAQRTAAATMRHPAPTNLSATNVTAAQVPLSWTASTGATAYRVERSAAGANQWSVRDTVTTLTYEDHAISGGTPYDYRVTATGPGADSIPAALTVTTPPAAPGSLLATPASTRIDLTWTDVTGEGGYKIERRPVTTPAAAWAQVATTAANVVTYSDTGLAVATPYEYRVRASSATAGVADSDYSPIAAATTKPTAPAAPSNVPAAVDPTGPVVLTWQDNSTNEEGGSKGKSTYPGAAGARPRA
jgi:hypothetical protein